MGEKSVFVLPEFKESVVVLPQGPFVQVDELMETFRRCTLPESKLLLSALLFLASNVDLLTYVSVRPLVIRTLCSRVKYLI